MRRTVIMILMLAAVLSSPEYASAAPKKSGLVLVIPKLELELPLYEVGIKNGVPVVPNHDLAWYNASARPGQGGNIVIWGHVLRFKSAPKKPAPFERLKELEKGDIFYIIDTVSKKQYNYKVDSVQDVLPSDITHILPTAEEQVTFVACTGKKTKVVGGIAMSHRRVVKSSLVSIEDIK